MTVVFLLVVIVVLLFTHQSERDYSLGLALLIAAFLWLAIKIRVIGILGSLFALALEHWVEIVMAFSAAVLLIVPVLMIYIVIRDEIDSRGLGKRLAQSHRVGHTKLRGCGDARSA